MPRYSIGNSTKAPDITIKYLRDKKLVAVLTMENKRAKFDGQSTAFPGRVSDLSLPIFSCYRFSLVIDFLPLLILSHGKKNAREIEVLF